MFQDIIFDGVELDCRRSLAKIENLLDPKLEISRLGAKAKQLLLAISAFEELVFEYREAHKAFFDKLPKIHGFPIFCCNECYTK